MRECKILEFSTYNEVRNLKRTPDVCDFPAIEKELNQYLAQGFCIRCMDFRTPQALTVMLEREK